MLWIQSLNNAIILWSPPRSCYLNLAWISIGRFQKASYQIFSGGYRAIVRTQLPRLPRLPRLPNFLFCLFGFHLKSALLQKNPLAFSPIFGLYSSGNSKSSAVMRISGMLEVYNFYSSYPLSSNIGWISKDLQRSPGTSKIPTFQEKLILLDNASAPCLSINSLIRIARFI